MAKSPYLGIDRINSLESSAGLKQLNKALAKLEASVNSQLRIDDIGNGPVTITEEEVTSNGVIILSGATDNFTVNVPATLNTNAIERSYIVKNNSPGFIATVTSGVGTSVIIPSGGTSYIFQDDQGINPVNDPESSGGGGGGSGDVIGPASSTDGQIALFNGVSGKILKTSVVTVDASGNITLAGTINGRDATVDGLKLDGIESGATADQTPAEIKTAYESNSNTNAFENADKSKLDAIESGATGDQTPAEIETSYNSQVTRPTVQEITDGTSTDTRRWTPADVRAAAEQHGGVGGGGSGDVTGPGSSVNRAISVFDVTTGDSITDTPILVDISGNMTFVGTINGRNISTDGSKLDGIESGATADQTPAEIKTAYESNSNTNVFDDTEKLKLGGIQSGAEVNPTASEIQTLYESNSDTNRFSDSLLSKLNSIDANHYGSPLEDTAALVALAQSSLTDKERRYVESEQSDYFYDSTASSGDLAPTDQTGGIGFWKKISSGGETSVSIKTKYESNPDTNAFTDSDQTKLSGIETGAEVNPTGAEISLALFAEADTNNFNNAYKSKLDGIDANATDDLTPAEIKTAYEGIANTNVFEDAEKAKLATIETGATADMTGAEISVALFGEADTNNFTTARLNKLDGIEDNATRDMTGAEISVALFGEADTNNFTTARLNKLDGIEDNATRDMTGAEISVALFGEADTNNFNNTYKTKLDGIENNADVTDAANVKASLEGASFSAEAPASNDGILYRDVDDSNTIKLTSPAEIATIANQSLTGTDVTDALDGHTLTAVTVQSSDKVMIQDDSDSDTIRTVTAQSIADLASSSSMTDEEVETAYNNRVPQVTSGEITTAQETLVRRFSPKDVADIAQAHTELSNPVTGGLVGINATATVTDRLAVSTDSVLLNNEGNNIHLKMNKNSETDSSFISFQNNNSHRAEVGLLGDDDLHVRVSPDGAAFHDAIIIDKDTGHTSCSRLLSGSIVVPDDSVGTLIPPYTGGFFFILANDPTFPQISHAGVFLFDVGTSLSLSSIHLGSLMSNLGTATSLTGTSGTDGETSVAARPNSIEIENRFGSTKTYTYVFIG